MHDNLGRLGIERLGGVNLRFMDGWEGGFEEQWTVLADLRSQGLVGDLGLSNCTPEQVKVAQDIAPVAMVQNAYNIAHRDDDAFVDALAEQGIYYVPFFPLGRLQPARARGRRRGRGQARGHPMQVALAWLLQRSPNILLIPGTSSVAHLEENLAAGRLSAGRRRPRHAGRAGLTPAQAAAQARERRAAGPPCGRPGPPGRSWRRRRAC